MEKFYTIVDYQQGNIIAKMNVILGRFQEYLDYMDQSFDDQEEMRKQIPMIQSLIDLQKDSVLPSLREGHWSLINSDQEMNAEARFDFVIIPTYYAVAILSRFKFDYPHFASHLNGLETALYKGLEFCVGTHLFARGREAWEGLLRALRILAQGKVPSLLNLDSQLNSQLLGIMKRQSHSLIKQSYQKDDRTEQGVSSRQEIQDTLRYLERTNPCIFNPIE